MKTDLRKIKTPEMKAAMSAGHKQAKSQRKAASSVLTMNKQFTSGTFWASVDPKRAVKVQKAIATGIAKHTAKDQRKQAKAEAKAQARKTNRDARLEKKLAKVKARIG